MRGFGRAAAGAGDTTEATKTGICSTSTTRIAYHKIGHCIGNKWTDNGFCRYLAIISSKMIKQTEVTLCTPADSKVIRQLVSNDRI